MTFEPVKQEFETINLFQVIVRNILSYGVEKNVGLCVLLFTQQKVAKG